MRVQADVTFAEFDEAVAAVRAVQMEEQKRRARRSPFTIGVSVGFAAALLVGLQFLGGGSVLTDPYPHLRPPAYVPLMIFLPLLAMILLPGIVAAAQQWGTPGKAIRRLALAFLPAAAIFGAIALLYWALHSLSTRPGAAGARTPAWVRPDWYGTLLPHAAWYGIALLVTVFLARATRAQVRQAWDGQPAVQRPKVYDLSVYGVSIDEQVVQRHYQWAGFVRYLETKNLLILCPSDVTFEILPKRCFPSPEQIDAARALMAGQIRDGRTAPAAFPVTPGPSTNASPPPLPAPVPSER